MSTSDECVPSAPQTPAARVKALTEALDTWQHLAATFRDVAGLARDPWEILGMQNGNAVPPPLDPDAEGEWRAREAGRAGVYAAARRAAAGVDAHGEAVANLMERAGLDSSPLRRLLQDKNILLCGEVRVLLGRLAARLEVPGKRPPVPAAACETEGGKGELGDGQFVFERPGDHWLIRFGTQQGKYLVSGNKGLQHLADLLSRPYRRLTGMELRGRSEAGPQPEHSFQPVLEGDALKKFKEDAREYARLIEQARRDKDKPAEERWLKELRELCEQWQTSPGLGGRVRRLGPTPKEAQAFDSVRKNIERCQKRLQDKLPDLVSHLEKTIRPECPDFIYNPAYDPLCPGPDWKF
jgi:hypothetical protein